MKLWINKKCPCGCGSPIYFRFISKWFSVSWHRDYEADSDDWFVYIHFGRHGFMFSNIGFLKYKID